MRSVRPIYYAIPFGLMFGFGLIDVVRTAWMSPRDEAAATDGAGRGSSQSDLQVDSQSDSQSDSQAASQFASRGRGPAAGLTDDGSKGASAEKIANRVPQVAPVPMAGPRPYPAFAPAREMAAPRTVPRAGLVGAIEKALAVPGLNGARVSVLVRSLNTGEDLFSRYSSEPRIVASNAKIVTTASALVHLGADFQFVTRVFARGPIVGGVLDGDLIVVGDGDPDVVTRATSDLLLNRLVAVVKEARVSEVTGRLIVDDRIFDRGYIPDGWKRSALGKHYSAPVSGFTIHENTLRVDISPTTPGALAKVGVYPDVPGLEPQIQLTTGVIRSKNLIDVPAPVTPGRVRVKGSTPAGSNPQPVYAPWIDAAETSARVLFEELTRRGPVKIRGGGALIEPDTDLSANGRAIEQIGSVKTSLLDVLIRMNKDSTNGVAEHVFKRAGAAFNYEGTTESAVAAVLEAFARLGVDHASASCADGSGLSRDNLYTVRQLVDLLDAMYARAEYRDALVASFAHFGADGTLDNRLSDDAYRGRAIAKSGWLSGACALSGFAQSDSGEVMAFSVLLNGFKASPSEMKRVHDEIVRALIDLAPYGGGA